MITARRLGAGDLAIFRALRLEALRAEPGAFASGYDRWAMLPEAEWVRRLAQPVLAVFDGADPVGLAGLLIEDNPRTAHRGKVVMVYVRASHRGRGVADALFAALEAEARTLGLRQLELLVVAENARAIAFYRRRGFAAVGRLPAAFVNDGAAVDEVMMVLPL